MSRISRSILSAAAGAAATPLASLAFSGGRWDARRAVLSAAVAAAWAAGYLLVAGRAWHPPLYIPLLLLWSAAAGTALDLLAPPSGERPAPGRALEPTAVLLSAGLAYAAAVVLAAGLSVMLRIGQPEATTMFGAEVFLWSSPALAVGAALGAYWNRLAGPASGRVVVSTLGAVVLLYLGNSIVTGIGGFVLLAWGFPMSGLLEGRWGWAQWASIVCGGAVIASLAGWAGSARSVGRVLLRCVLAVAILVGYTLHSCVLRGLHAGWHVRMAVRSLLEPDPQARTRAIERLRTALAVRPDAPDRAYLLWGAAAEAAADGQEAQAEEFLRAAAALPEDVLGQEYVLRAKEVLRDHAAATSSARAPREVPGPLAVEGNSYLDADWRSAVGLWRSALPKERTTESLARLQKLSRSEKKISLPHAGGWAALAAYSDVYGAPVTLAEADAVAVRSILDSGRPVLVRRDQRFLLIVGHVPAFKAFRFLEYKQEQPWLAAELARAEAAGAVADDERPRLARLARLRAMIVDMMPEAELARALADSAGLCAWPEEAARRPDPARQAWLLGEAAMDGGDPVLALERYEKAWTLSRSAWLLPYAHAAALKAERDHSGIKERRLAVDPVAAAFAAWRRPAARRAWLETAVAEVRRAPAASLPTPVLRRLSGLLDPREPSEQALLSTCHSELARRLPEDPSAVEGLAESRRAAKDALGWRSAALRLRSLKPQDSAPLLDAVEASLSLGDVVGAAELLARVNPLDAGARGRRLALAGRLALKRGRPGRARRLLESAASVERSDAELHRDLAEALDALGRGSEAARHWRWVERVAIEPSDLEAARKRLAAP